MNIKDFIRNIPDYPRKGVMFRDLTTLWSDARGFRRVVDELVQPYAGTTIDKVVGIESRGFVVGGAVAHQLSVGFIPVRKQGKLPWKTIGEDYSLEYGMDRLEIHEDAINPGEKILIVDDLVATGGTVEAAIKLVRRAGGQAVACSFIIDLPFLGGADRIRALDVPVMTLCAFDGE